MDNYLEKGKLFELAKVFVESDLNHCLSFQKGIEVCLFRDEFGNKIVSDGEYSIKVVFSDINEEKSIRLSSPCKLILCDWCIDMLGFENIGGGLSMQLVLLVLDFKEDNLFSKDKQLAHLVLKTPNINSNKTIQGEFSNFRSRYMRVSLKLK